MFYVKKRLEIAIAHKLKLDYESKCSHLHGHNIILEIFCKSEELNDNGMVIDFTEIKSLIHSKLDHQYLNDILDFNTTSENLAKWICNEVPNCYKVSVIESENNIAIYEI